MAWEVLAIWAIVLTTIIWFVSDERRERANRLDEQALNFATSPAWRHREAALRPAAPQLPSDDLIEIQRRFAAEMRRQS